MFLFTTYRDYLTPPLMEEESILRRLLETMRRECNSKPNNNGFCHILLCCYAVNMYLR